jgi:hypothetical protein
VLVASQLYHCPESFWIRNSRAALNLSGSGIPGLPSIFLDPEFRGLQIFRAAKISVVKFVNRVSCCHVVKTVGHPVTLTLIFLQI